MKKIFSIAVVAIMALFVASCGSMPKKNEYRADDRPEIVIDEAGIGSQVYIDGGLVGVATDDNRNFVVSPGNHDVRIVKPNGQVIERSVFVQGNTKREISTGN